MEKEIEKLETKIGKEKKVGRQFFSFADVIGTAGKFFVQIGALLLLIGLASATGAQICQTKVNKNISKKRALKAQLKDKNK